MSFQRIENLFSNAAPSPYAFAVGSVLDIDIYPNTETQVWLVAESIRRNGLIIASSLSTNDTYTLELFIFQKDKQSASMLEETFAIIKACEQVAMQLLANLNNTEDIESLSYTITPIAKYSAKRIFSGVSVEISFQFATIGYEYC